jgi:nucleobase:cation symporter-1, NCS1 family
MSDGTAAVGGAPLESAGSVREIEKRSIDWVPHDERHGKPWHLGPVWFSGNAELTTTATGVLCISLGGNLLWTLIAMALGVVFGTFFSAFHSAQGPQLGLPQMIQSRAQFGYLGVAVFVLPAIIFNYAGYNVFNGLLAAQAVNNVVGGISINLALVVVSAVGAAAAIWGYDLIHLSQRWLTYAFIIFFGIYTVGVLFTIGLPAGSFDLGNFQATPFFASFALVVSYQLGWAPYVSDYSRYLPANVPTRETLFWTYAGLAIGGMWMFGMGALIAAPIAANGPSTIEAIRSTGDAVFGGFGEIVLLLSVPALVMILAMNMYGGSLTLISMLDSFKPLKVNVSHRVMGILAICIASLIGGIYANANFLANYNNLIVILLYLFTPWTAVNLVDYFLVRRGHYVIADIFKPDGIYGRWGWRGIAAYLVGFVAMIPFFVVGTWFTGPIADRLNSTDLSIFVGLPVSAIVYIYLARSLDLRREIELANAETAADIEREEMADHARRGETDATV